MFGLPAFAGFPFPTPFPEGPPLPTSGLALWLDATQGVTLDGATSRVAAWVSRVGSAAASQATTSPMPLLSTMNGLASVSFDGADDELVLSGLAAVGEVSTYFAVFQAASLSAGRCVWGAVGSGSHTYYVTTAGQSRLYTGNVAAIALGGAGEVTAGARCLGCAAFDRNAGSAGPWTLRLNRSVRGSGTVGVAPFAANDRIGYGQGGGRFAGLVSEILLYGRVLAPAEIVQVETYLQTKWGTP